MNRKEKVVREMLISRLIGDITTNRICLPSFQRDFVWNPDQMAKLLESVVRHYPIGTMMLLDANGNSALGKLSFVSTQSSAFTPRHYVIDGQQRLKTFLDLLSSDGKFKPKDPIQYKGANYKVFYRAKVSLPNIGYDVDKPTFIVPKKTEPHEMDDYEKQGREGLIPIEFLLNERLCRLWTRKALPRHKNSGRNRILRNIREVRNRIHKYSCPVEIIRMKLRAEEHSNMFRLLNEGGTDLTVFDLLVARLAPFDIDLRALWKGSCKELPNLELFRVDPIYILKTMLLIRPSEEENRTCTLPQVRRIHKLYRNEPNVPKAFERDWHDASRFMDKAINDLKNDYGVANPKYLPYSPMLIPLAATKYYVNGYDQRFKGRMKKKLSLWYWGSIFCKAYEMGTDTRVGEHYTALIQWLAPGARSKIPSVINFKMSKGELEEAVGRVKSTADAIYKAILCIPLSLGASDLYSNDFLRNGAKLHDHHIFPKGFLRTLSENDSDMAEEMSETMNHPVNRMLITDKTNLEIKDRPPQQYLYGIDARILKRNLLPRQLAENKLNFTSFFEKRKAMIIEFAFHHLVN
jgi:hypothetical protein